MWEPWMATELHYANGGFTTKRGKVAGCRYSNGYWMIGLRYKRYLRHRLVWSYFNGPIPDGAVIDHIDGIPGNDWPENLRLTSHAGNMAAGTPLLSANNTSRFNNVSWRKDCSKWHAQITLNGRRKHVGYYTTAEAAHAAASAYRASAGIDESRRLL